MAASDELLDRAAAIRDDATPLTASATAASDELLDNLARQQRQRVDAVLDRVLPSNPDREAEAQRLAATFHLDADTVSRNQEELARIARAREIRSLMAASPVLARQLTDPAFAALAHDDVENLSALGQTLSFLKGTVTSLAGAVPRINEGIWGVVRAGAEALPGGVGQPVANVATESGQAARAWAEYLTPRGDNAVSQSWYSGMQSLGVNLVQLPLIYFSGGSLAPMLMSMGLTTGGQAYGEARDKGVGTADALIFGTSQGLVEAGTELIGMPALFRLIEPGKFATKALEYLVKEQGGEQIATALQDANEWAVLPENQHKSFADYLAERPNAALQTALATAFGGGGQVAVVKGVQLLAQRGEQKATNAAQGAEVVDRINQLAKASKLAARDPQTFEQFIAKAAEDGPVSQVFIDAQTLLQSGVAEQVAAVSPSVATQLPIAAATGGQVAIPVGEYAARIAPTEYAQGLLDHLKTDPEGFSRAEAQAYLQSGTAELAAEFERALTEQQGNETFNTSRDAVKTAILADMNAAGRFTAGKNEADATLYSAYYAVRAAQMGITPEALYAQRPVRFAAESVEGQQFGQGGTLEQVKQAWSDVGLAHAVSEHGGVITVSKIVVPEGERGAGRGTAAMQALIDYADRTGQHIALTPSADFGGNKKRLTQFYKRFGFVENKGKNRAFTVSEDMYRPAAGKVLHQSGLTPTAQAVQRWHEALKFARPANMNYAPKLDTPTVLREMGLKQAKLALPTRVLVKILGKHPDVPATVIENLPALLADPLAIYPHRDGGLRVVIDAVTAKGEPIVVGVGERIQTVTPIHDKDGLTGAQRVQLAWDHMTAQRGVKLYARNEEAPTEARASAGAPSATIALRRDSHSVAKVVTRAQLVNRHGANFYQPADGSAPRGAFNPETLTVSLLKGADLSTALHEGAHFFFENDIALAAQLAEEAQASGPEALKPGERQLLADTSALFTWHGIQGDLDAQLDQWATLGFEERRAYHERTAESFELYLVEGKAPSLELQPYFQRFRAWLLNVYTSLKDFLAGHPEAGKLDDTVRGVFDRMLATTEQIQLAEQARSLMPLFASAEQSGMTPEAFAAYQALGVDASNDAIQELQARGLRDMSWLHNARGRIVKQLQEENAAKRAEIEPGVRKEVSERPIYRAMRWLKHGEMTTPEGEEVKAEKGFRLDLGALREMYPESMLARPPIESLTRERLAGNEGMHPDLAAQIFGFTSGDQLVRELLVTEPMQSVIDTLTDARLLEQFGDLTSPEAIEKAADWAIHNEARARFVATEANALAKATGKPRILASAAKEVAAAIVARLKIRGIRPGQYASAEARAAKAAEKARKAGDTATAAAEKRNQILQIYATRAAYDAQEEVAKGLRYLKRFTGEVKGLDQGFADQISALLARYDLRKQTQKEIDRTKSLRSWVMARLADGEIPDIADSLLSAQDRARYIAQTAEINEKGEYVYADDNERIKLLADYIDRAAKTSYRDLTVEQFRGLLETVRQMEHLGRLKDRLLTSHESKALGAIKDDIAGSIRENARKDGRNLPTRDDLGSRVKKSTGRFMADHIRMALRALVMDGGKDGGAMWRYFIRPANEAEQHKLDLTIQLTERLNDILSPILKHVSVTDRLLKGKDYKALGTNLNWQNRFAILLNLGNEGNTQRLLSGGVGGRQGLSLADLMPVLSEFSAAELKAAQAVWDTFESLRPELASLERETKGKEPEWIEPRPLTIRSREGELVTLRGGYYPIAYDPATNVKAAENLEAEEGSYALRAARAASTTRQSFVKSRVAEVQGRPLLLTLDSLFRGFSDTIHHLSYARYTIDTNKLLRSKRIQAAMLEHYGAESVRQLRKFAEDLVAGPQRLNDSGEMASAFIRQNVSLSLLAINLNSWLKQPFGISNAVTRLGGGAEGMKWVGKGLYYFSLHPVRAIRDTMAASAFIQNRPRTRFRELNEIRNKVQVEGLKQKLAPWMMSGLVYTQIVADVITWRAAYERAVHHDPATDERTLVALADQAVRDAQGSGEQVDQSAIERGGPLLKLFTTLFNFQNTGTNLAYLSANTKRSAATRMVDYLMVFTVPVLVDALFAAALIPHGDDDDDDDSWWKWLLLGHLTQMLGGVVGVREVTPAVKALFGEGFGYHGPTGIKTLSDIYTFGEQAGQAEFDDAFRKATINVVGDFTGLPAVQTNRTITGVQALAEGKTDNPAAVVFGFKESRR